MDLGGVDLLSRASHKRRALEKKRVYEGHGHGHRRGLAWLDFFLRYQYSITCTKKMPQWPAGTREDYLKHEKKIKGKKKQLSKFAGKGKKNFSSLPIEFVEVVSCPLSFLWVCHSTVSCLIWFPSIKRSSRTRLNLTRRHARDCF